MTAADRPIRRILVALDGSSASLAALDTAAELARTLDAELRGVYVEESDLLQLAEIAPLAREVDALSARVRPLEARRLRREVRVQSRRVRRRFERRVRAVEVRWSFERVRGTVPAELRRAAASEADLLVVGLRGRSRGRGAGSTVRALLRQAVLPLMVLPRGARMGGRVYVAVRDPEADRRALDVASAVAAGGAPLHALLVAEGEAAPGRPAAETAALRGALERVLPEGRAFDVRSVLAPTARDLGRLLVREPCGILVLPRDLVRAADDGLAPLVERLRCPVLVTA